jgi:hypothetical protein
VTSGLVGDIGKLRRLEQSLRELPRVVGQKVATASARTITSLAHATFDAGENAYGDTWAPGAHGQRVTLRKSGRLASFAFVAVGTRLRARLGPKYAKFQVGRRPVFPRQGARLPTSYVDALRLAAAEVIRAELGGVRR